ncbi:hypothetical protein [Sagittula sp. S175]|uniref:hypothetical protein n=1 Tax=Sagittula sp. S175 TaxID=3415129 RepID=UPI003C7C0960
MTQRNAFMITTAIALGVGVPSLAAENQITLQQSGEGNQVLIDQSQGTGNWVGDAGSGVAQSGNTNQLTLTQIGFGNVIGSVQQTGDMNEMTLIQRGDNNTIATASQNGQGNRFTIQERVEVMGNSVEAIQQDGTNNNFGFTLEGSDNGGAPLTGDAMMTGAVGGMIVQSGSGQNADFSIGGNRNQFASYQAGTASMFYWSIYGDDNQMALSYEGTGGNNILGIHSNGSRNNVGMRMFATGGSGNYGAFYLPAGADDNQMWASQFGDRNEISVEVQGTFNDIDVVQEQEGNAAWGFVRSGNNQVNVVQMGYDQRIDLEVDGGMGGNLVHAMQTGGTNTLAVNIFAENTNAASGVAGWDLTPMMMSGAAGDVAGMAGLTGGALMQSGYDNSLRVEVGQVFPGGTGNAFAVSQMGDLNSAQLSLNGDFNQVAVSQGSSFNVANVAVEGAYNSVGIIQ